MYEFLLEFDAVDVWPPGNAAIIRGSISQVGFDSRVALSTDPRGSLEEFLPSHESESGLRRYSTAGIVFFAHCR
jgi:hypothetical protein